MSEQQVTITLTYDDVMWRRDDAREAAREAAHALAGIAQYHRAIVRVDDKVVRFGKVESRA